MKLLGLRLMGPRGMSMLLLIRRIILGVVWAILGLCVYFDKIFASGGLKWLKFFTVESCHQKRISVNVRLLVLCKGHVECKANKVQVM